MLVTLLAALLLSGCTAEDNFKQDSSTGVPEVTEPEFVRTPPPVVLAEYVGTNQVTNDDGSQSGLIDMTNMAKGYIAVQCKSSVRARVRIVKGAESDQAFDDYTIENDGTTSFYPLTRGDGSYTFILYIFAGDTPAGPSYTRFIETSATVALADDKGPYLVQNHIVNYDENSQCVKLSHEITQHCSTNLEVVQQVYAWISQNIDYDVDKAQNINNGSVEYVPNPDSTLRSKTGICYDYASLAAAMLRANGIPTKLIKGDVLNNGEPVYHAWNMVWLAEAGWIAVELPSKPGDWARIDTTFAAAGTGMGQFIGDGQNYTDLSQH